MASTIVVYQTPADTTFDVMGITVVGAPYADAATAKAAAVTAYGQAITWQELTATTSIGPAIGGGASGAAGGDLAGTYPNPTIVASGLPVKVASTVADFLVARNHTDDGWLMVAAPGPVLSKPDVTGLKAANAALTSLLAGLVTLGLITDSTGA